MNRWLLAVMNSSLSWWYSWHAAVHGKDKALRFIRDYVSIFLIAEADASIKKKPRAALINLIGIKTFVARTSTVLRNWYAFELEIDRLSRVLAQPYLLSVDQFLGEVRNGWGKSRQLSAAGVQEVREEYFKTVQPAQRLLRVAEQLEQRLHDLVNEAYSLKPDEVRLMWDTAPPRIPLANERADQVGEAAA